MTMSCVLFIDEEKCLFTDLDTIRPLPLKIYPNMYPLDSFKCISYSSLSSKQIKMKANVLSLNHPSSFKHAIRKDAGKVRNQKKVCPNTKSKIVTLPRKNLFSQSYTPQQLRKRTAAKKNYDLDDFANPCKRRDNHNVLERIRRNDLRASFLNLESCMWNGSVIKRRTSKLSILRQAISYIHIMKREQEVLMTELSIVCQQREQLLLKLKSLSK